MLYEECEHNFINNNCEHCGLIIEKFFENKKENPVPYQSLDNKTSILDSLVNIPVDVIMKTRQNISRKQNETGKKIRNDAKNTFIQLYEAFLECGYDNFNPNTVAKQLGLTRKEINWCLKQSSQTSLVPSVHEDVNKQISIVILSPVAFIDEVCERNGVSKFIPEIKKLTRHILEEKDILYCSRPEFVACGIVKKYCETNGINTKSFSKNNNISDNALKNIINDIEEFF